MTDSPILERIQRCVSGFDPGARILRTWPLSGGMSATMTAFEVELSDGGRKKMVTRQPSVHKLREHPKAAEEEFRVLRELKAVGLPCQTAYALEDHSEPFFVVEYLEGRPEVDPPDPAGFLRRFAAQLAQIHQVDLATVNLNFLAGQGKGYGRRRAAPNEALREREICDALESVSPIMRSNPPVLRHGDFWPGNVLWQDGEISGVIDWEECLIGEPLADVAICRLDLWWILGEAAAYEFTAIYQALVNLDLGDLPYWDLCASLRPITNLEEWSPSYPLLGRPDVTTETMARDHQAFVEQALVALRGGSLSPKRFVPEATLESGGPVG